MIAEVTVRFPSQQAPVDLSIPRDSFNLPVLLKEALLARIQPPVPPVQHPADYLGGRNPLCLWGRGGSEGAGDYCGRGEGFFSGEGIFSQEPFGGFGV